MQRILIIGGGFAGLSAALNAVDESDRHSGDLRVTMVSPSPYITIRPRLYEQNPETLREPLAPVLDPAGVAFITGSARSIDTAGRKVQVETADGGAVSLGYDRLILAAGSELSRLPEVEITALLGASQLIEKAIGSVIALHHEHRQRKQIHPQKGGHAEVPDGQARAVSCRLR